MKLIKINPVYYIIVDKVKIELLDWIIDSKGIIRQITTQEDIHTIRLDEGVLKITHSTILLLTGKSTSPCKIPLSIVNDILSGVDGTSSRSTWDIELVSGEFSLMS